jgi:hypothetical protein
MDLSKLPGKEPGAPTHPATGTAQPPPLPPQAPEGATYPSASTELPRELWISGPEALLWMAVALFFVWQGQTLFHHADVDVRTPTGTSTISYWQSWYFINDGPLVLMGAALAWETIAMAVVRKRWAGWSSVALLGIAALANLGSSVKLTMEMGLQYIPALAVLVGAYGCWSTTDKLKT